VDAFIKDHIIYQDVKIGEWHAGNKFDLLHVGRIKEVVGEMPSIFFRYTVK